MTVLNVKLLSEEDKKALILDNIRTILFYALSLSIALGLNDVIVSIFASFPRSQHIISKMTYVVILFGFTLLLANWISGHVIT